MKLDAKVVALGQRTDNAFRPAAPGERAGAQRDPQGDRRQESSGSSAMAAAFAKLQGKR